MSKGERQENLGDMVRAAALEGAKLGVPLIMPWRMEANQDDPHKGLDVCGCGVCPDDGQEPT